MKRPAPSTVVAGLALVVAASGTSYAAGKIDTADIKNGAVTSAKIENGTIKKKDLSEGVLAGITGADGVDGVDGADGTGRWLLVDRNGEIVAQSGGFAIRAAYDLVNNQLPDNTVPIPAGAVGNVYIDANEDLSNNGITVSIALQNALDQNGDMIMNGRSLNPDADPEFSGEITTTICGVAGIVGCAPSGANNRNHFVVSPRLSDGQVTDSTNRKRFYVIITGDSSDYVEPTPAIPAVPLAPNPNPIM